MTGISFDHVRKQFGAVLVVEDFDLEVVDGELLVLVGGSGSGKSTILRMLAGLESVTSGTIRIGDTDVTSLAPRERDVAMVFQDYALYPHMTVRENLALGLRLRRIARAEVERRVNWAAGILGLESLLDRKPKALSGGQRQRVAMGRAMVREPAVFLFDEPLSNLDAGLRAQMRIEIGALQRRLATTTMYVTHDQVEAMTLGDRIVVLAGGRIQQVGRPIDLYRTPANRFVAGFIGTPPMNFVEGRVEAQDGETRFVADGLRVAMPPSASRIAAGGRSGTITLGVRPDDLLVEPFNADRGEPVATEPLRGRVVLVERLGATSHLHLDVGKTNPHRLLATIAGEDPPRVGDDVAVRVRSSNVHLFDAEGRALR